MKNQKSIPEPAISRLCKIYSILEEAQGDGVLSVSSKDLGLRIGVGSHSIRKDINFLGEPGTIGSGYDVVKLKRSIEDVLSLNIGRNACIIGLGDFGTAIMKDAMNMLKNYQIVAGFDSNINILETIQTDIPVYPTYEIIEVVKRMKIEMAVLTPSIKDIEKMTERLIEGGIRGIINLSAVLINTSDNNVFIRNLDLLGELRYLSALVSLRA